MPNLQETVAGLARQFAEEVLRALREASLEDVAALGAGAGRGGRKAARAPETEYAVDEGTQRRRSHAAAGLPRAKKGGRRTGEDFQKLVEAIVGILQKHPEGLRSEQLQAELGLAKKDMPRPLKLALDAKVIRKKGQKRATTYFAR